MIFVHFLVLWPLSASPGFSRPLPASPCSKTPGGEEEKTPGGGLTLFPIFYSPILYFSRKLLLEGSCSVWRPTGFPNRGLDRLGGDTIKSMKISEFFQQTRNLLSQKLVSYNFDLTFTMYFLQLFLRMCNSLAKSVSFFCHCLDFANSPMKNCDFPVQEAPYFAKSVKRRV